MKAIAYGVTEYNDILLAVAFSCLGRGGSGGVQEFKPILHFHSIILFKA